jgi:hypothetical protein
VYATGEEESYVGFNKLLRGRKREERKDASCMHCLNNEINEGYLV